MRGVTRAFSSTEYTAVPFHPALPMREVIYIRFNESRIFLISTRTPHAGSDCNIMCKFTASINI